MADSQKMFLKVKYLNCTFFHLIFLRDFFVIYKYFSSYVGHVSYVVDLNTLVHITVTILHRAPFPFMSSFIFIVLSVYLNNILDKNTKNSTIYQI